MNVLRYLGFPGSWGAPLQETVAQKTRNEMFFKELVKAEQKPTVYVEGFGGNLIAYIQNFISADYQLLQGIDFVEYFSNSFEDKEPIRLNIINVIYNVGLEPALNLKFSAQLLRYIIAKAKQENVYLFLVSDFPYTNFKEKYDIEVVNRIKLPKLKDEQLI